MVTPRATDMTASQIIVAVDLSKKRPARKLVKLLRGHVGWFKFGFEAILALGPEWIAKLAKEYGIRLFADVKLNDIPNTVGKATAALATHGFAAMNVHCSCSMEALKAVAANKGSMLAFGVTVLTSIDTDECVAIFGDTPGKKVLEFARRAKEAGLDGIICSPQEAEMLRKYSEFDQMQIWTPGIRSKDAPPDDQARTRTPAEAALYADGLVIGRPIVEADDSVAAARAIALQMAESRQSAA